MSCIAGFPDFHEVINCETGSANAKVCRRLQVSRPVQTDIQDVIIPHGDAGVRNSTIILIREFNVHRMDWCWTVLDCVGLELDCVGLKNLGCTGVS